MQTNMLKKYAGRDTNKYAKYAKYATKYAGKMHESMLKNMQNTQNNMQNMSFRQIMTKVSRNMQNM